MNTFTVESNNYLEKTIEGFFHTEYLGYYNPGNPSFLNDLKNTFDSYPEYKLSRAAGDVENILSSELPCVLSELDLSAASVCVMPRAKAKDNYSDDQLRFLRAVSDVVDSMGGLENGTDWITRHTDTRTTHLGYHDSKGRKPYIGITTDTCHISSKVRDKDIILVDDIYTKTVNVNEDAIQALLDAGAKSVALYVVAKTKKKH